MTHLRLLLACILVLAAATAAAQTAITYQGQLKRSGLPLTGMADMRFKRFESLTGNDPVASPITRNDVPVEDGFER